MLVKLQFVEIELLVQEKYVMTLTQLHWMVVIVRVLLKHDIPVPEKPVSVLMTMSVSESDDETIVA
jgi:hypothetical protein